MAVSLPTLPRMRMKWKVDHCDESFIEERRLQLETYLQMLLHIPHVCSEGSSAFLGLLSEARFLFLLNLYPSVCNQGGGNSNDSVVPVSGNIVLSWVTLLITAALHSFFGRSTFGTGVVSLALSSIQGVAEGDILLCIGGFDCSNNDPDDMEKKIMRSPRPLVLHFVTP